MLPASSFELACPNIKAFTSNIFPGFNKLFYFILCIVWNELEFIPPVVCFSYILSKNTHAGHYQDSPILCVSRPSVRKHCNSFARSTWDPKHLRILVCLEELALVTTKRGSKTRVLVRRKVKESLTNTGL